MSLVSHKTVRLNYELLETFQAGISLLGTEVKALKGGLGKLEGSYVSLDGEEAYLVGAEIPAYQPKNAPPGYETGRRRKLLLHKKEIRKLFDSKKTQGLTVVPVSFYNKGGCIKLDIALARGKKKHDKREAIKKRDTERDLGRKLK